MEDLLCELVAGGGCIHEELLGLRFRISPHSFFQVPPLAPQTTSRFDVRTLIEFFKLLVRTNCENR